MRFLLFLLLLCPALSAKAQNARVSFGSESPATIEIFAPVDGFPQTQFVSERIETDAQTKGIYETGIKEYEYVMVQVNGRKLSLLLFPGDKVEVFLNKDSSLKITGSNDAGHEYFNQYFFRNVAANILRPVSEILQQTDDYENVVDEVHTRIIMPHTGSLSRLSDEHKISPDFSRVTQKSISNYILYETCKLLRSLHLNKTISADEKQIVSRIIFDTSRELSGHGDIHASPFNIPIHSFIYKQLYDRLSEEEKERSARDFDTAMLGPNVHYLLAPDSLKPSLFAHAVFTQIKYAGVASAYGFAPVDAGGLILYLQRNYPESGYIPILNEMAEAGQTPAEGQVIFIEKEVHKLEELSQLEELKGKYLFIDIWATWCMPCLKEFDHNEALRHYMENSPGLECVYISIDEPAKNGVWEKFVTLKQLAGYHIHASEPLKEDIKKLLYRGQSISIPRYVLLSPAGRVIDPDLPRPSTIESLKRKITEGISSGSE